MDFPLVFAPMKSLWNEVPWCVYHGKFVASEPSKLHGIPVGICPYETPMELRSMVLCTMADPWRLYGRNSIEFVWGFAPMNLPWIFRVTDIRWNFHVGFIGANTYGNSMEFIS